MVFIASGSSQSGCVSFVLYTNMPFQSVGKPPRSLHDWLCRFCVTSSGNPYRNNGFRKECHRCHLAKGEAFKARSEHREPPTKSTKESARSGSAGERVGTDTERQRKKSEESAQQEINAPTKAAYKKAIKASWRIADDWIVRRRPPGDQDGSKQRLDQAKAASDEFLPFSKRIRAG